MRVRDRLVLVTGASSGIGRATALRLARAGATVVAAARNAERLDTLAATHPNITAVTCDVTVEADRARLVDEAGPVDVLVNNAGVGWMGLVESMPAADVRALVETNVVALIDLTQRVLPGMIERGLGHVVNVASVASWVAFPPYTVYSATKWAVQGFTEGLRRELLGRGVTAGTVNPGPIATEFFARAAGATEPTGEPIVGPGTSLVAGAVARSIRLRHVPGYQTISVPRPIGLARVLGLPVAARAVDVAALPSRLLGR
ncbi:MAG: SDR family NAD(P)-dependent oxidoreductase [Actinobacteria bacterium]|nr:SDR family NAD(P)-dependent oxidoreductase [Actinomycetota bacterium]